MFEVLDKLIRMSLNTILLQNDKKKLGKSNHTEGFSIQLGFLQTFSYCRSFFSPQFSTNLI